MHHGVGKKACLRVGQLGNLLYQIVISPATRPIADEARLHGRQGRLTLTA